MLQQDDPTALARVLEVLRQHPQFADHFASKLDAVPAAARDRYATVVHAIGEYCALKGDRVGRFGCLLPDGRAEICQTA